MMAPLTHPNKGTDVELNGFSKVTGRKKKDAQGNSRKPGHPRSTSKTKVEAADISVSSIWPI